MSQPRDPSRRPAWLLVAFAALLLAPTPLVLAGFGAGTVVALARAAIRGGRRRADLRSTAGLPASATLLGADRAGASVLLDDRQLSAHGLILGATGAGKSTTLLAILTDQIRRGRPVIAIDMKGSPAFARQLAGAAVSAGRAFRLWTLDGPGVWNPLEHGNATELKDKLIATERFSEPHYQRAAERYVQTALQVLHEIHPGRPATLDEVVALMDPRRLGGMLRGVSSDRATQVQDYLAGLTHDQVSAVRGLGTRLAIISESHTGRFLSPESIPSGEPIDLREALDGGQVVLFSLNSSTYGKLAAQLGTLVVQDLVATVGHKLTEAGGVADGQMALAGGARAGPAIIGIDEFSAIGADNVVSLLARGREAGASVLLATQELADLDRAAIGLRDQVLGNTAIKIAHRQDVPASAQTIAQMAGTVTRWEETRQTGAGLFGGYDTGRGTRREAEQFVVHPNEIKSLRTGEAVVIVKQPRSLVRTVTVQPPPAVRRAGRDGPEL